MAVPFLACVFTHLSLNSWPLFCSLYFETNFKKEKKITGKIPLLMQDSESLQPAWFPPFFVLSTVSGYWFAIESEEQGMYVFIFKRVLRRRKAVSEEQLDCRSIGSLKTCGLHSKSLWLTSPFYISFLFLSGLLYASFQLVQNSGEGSARELSP